MFWAIRCGLAAKKAANPKNQRRPQKKHTYTYIHTDSGSLLHFITENNFKASTLQSLKQKQRRCRKKITDKETLEK